MITIILRKPLIDNRYDITIGKRTYKNVSASSKFRLLKHTSGMWYTGTHQKEVYSNQYRKEAYRVS